jgi:hypothetical protein
MEPASQVRQTFILPGFGRGHADLHVVLLLKNIALKQLPITPQGYGQLHFAHD